MLDRKMVFQAIRCFLYVLVILLGVLSHLSDNNFVNWELLKYFYGVSILALSIHVLSFINLQTFFNKRVLIGATFIMDVVFVSALMKFSDLNQSLFLFMYFIVILLSGLFFHLRGALIMAAFASFCFSLISFFSVTLVSTNFLFLFILNNLAFFILAFLAGYMSQELNLFEEKVKLQDLSLKALQRINEIMLQTVPSALATISENGSVVAFNPGFEKLFSGAARGQLIQNIFPEFGWMPSAVTPGKIQIRELKNRQDMLLRVQTIAQEQELVEERTYLFIVEDLTEIRRFELQAKQAEKLAAIGGLAAGIAHEIRNPLASISGSIELLSQQSTTEDDKKLTKIILKEIARLNNLISEFLDYAKPEKTPTDSVSLQTVVRDSLDVALQQYPDVVKDFAMDSKSSILGHSEKLKQVFLNFFINSAQAMQNAATKKLTVKILEEEKKYVVEISDTGEGISDQAMKRLFEPFHTTKPKGTGLGLAISRKILDAHKAQIEVSSAIGRGTTFRILFPRESV